jgi:hypothetical protein
MQVKDSFERILSTVFYYIACSIANLDYSTTAYSSTVLQFSPCGVDTMLALAAFYSS